MENHIDLKTSCKLKTLNFLHMSLVKLLFCIENDIIIDCSHQYHISGYNTISVV